MWLYLSGCGHVFIASWTPTVKECFCPECKMEVLIEPQFGTMLKHLQEESQKSPRMSISSSAASREHARTSVLQDLEKAWQGSEADYFSRSSDCVAKLSRDGSFWKTYLPLLPEEEQKWSERLPKWGMTVAGALYPLRPLERYTVARGGSFLPTPGATEGGPLPPDTDYRPNQRSYNKRTGKHVQITIRRFVEMWPTPKASECRTAGIKSESKRNNPSLWYRVYEHTGMKLNVLFVEWLMEFPIGWTELSPWVMQWLKARRKKRSKS